LRLDNYYKDDMTIVSADNYEESATPN